MPDVAIASSLSAAVTVTGALTLVHGISGAGSVSVAAAGAATFTSYIDGSGAWSVEADADAGVVMALAAGARITVTAEAGLNAGGATIRDVIDEIFILWGFGCGAGCENSLRASAMRILNGAVQFVAGQAKALSYLHQATRTYTLADGVGDVPLQNDVQNLTGPVRWVPPIVGVGEILTAPYKWRIIVGDVIDGTYDLELTVDGTAETITLEWDANAADVVAAFETHSLADAGDVTVTGSNGDFVVTSIWNSADLTVDSSSSLVAGGGIPLTPVATRGQLDRFHQIFPYTLGEPSYYHVESEYSTSGDGVTVELMVRPVPKTRDGILPGSLVVDLAVEPPHFIWGDYVGGTNVPMPHRYVESLLLPICRFHGMNHHRFVRPELAPGIEAAYRAALVMFGMVDPAVKETERGADDNG